MSKYDEIIKEEPHEKILSISPEKICCQSLVRGWRRYPEPVQFIFVLMFSICIVPRDKIFIDKVCKLDLQEYLEEHNLTTEVCNVMSRNKTFQFVETETQGFVSALKVYEGLIMNIPSIFFSMFAGGWADKRGRKIIMALPFIGNILSSLWLLVSVLWWDMPAKYLIIAGVSGWSGGYMCLNIGLYSYISDTSSPQTRTTRMSLLTGIFSLGYVIGVQIGGRISSYVTIFILSSSLGVLGLLYSILVLEESLPKPLRTKSSESTLTLLLGCWKTMFRTRDGTRRFLLLCSVFQFQAFMLCINTTEYDYLMTRLKFSWERADFSNYLTAQRTCRLIGLLMVLPILANFFKVRDSIVVSGGCIVSCAAYIVLGVSSPAWGGDWPVYLSAVLQFNSVTTVSIRSILSKLVEPSEVGKIFAVLGIGQAIIALVSHSMLGVIYSLSLEFYPTMYLLPVVILLIIAFILSLFHPHLFKPEPAPALCLKT